VPCAGPTEMHCAVRKLLTQMENLAAIIRV